MALAGTVSLLFSLNADASDADRELEKFRKNVEASTKSLNENGNASGVFTRLAQGAGLSAEQTAKLGAALPVVGAAIAGVAAAAAGAAVGLFALAKNAADFGSEIFDASEKTGVSAKTLSSLKLAADESGSSLEAVAGGISKFSKLVGEAGNGSKEAAEKLKRLGIDPQDAINDLEGSLAKVFKRIADLPPGVNQAAAATDAFGRSGTDLIGTIKSFDGDLAALTKRAEELGVTLTDKDAQAADDFGDTLDDLTKQFSGLSNIFSRQFMPVLTSGMKDLSRYLSDNRESARSWGTTTANAVGGVIEAFKDLGAAANQIELPEWAAAILFGSVPYNYYKRGQAKNQKATQNQATVAEITNNEGGAYDSRTGKPKGLNPDPYLSDTKAADDAAKKAEEIGKKKLDATLKNNALDQELAEKNYKRQLADIEDLYKTRELNEAEYRTKLTATADALRAAMEPLLNQELVLRSVGKLPEEVAVIQKEIQGKLNEIGAGFAQKAKEATKTVSEENKKISDERQKAIDDSLKASEASNQQWLDKRLADNKVEIINNEYLFAQKAITERDYYAEKFKLAIDAIAYQKSVVTAELALANLSAEKRTELENKLAVIDQEIRAQQLANGKELLEVNERNAEKEKKTAEDKLEAIKKQAETIAELVQQAREESEQINEEKDPETFGGGLFEGLKDLTPIQNLGNALAELGSIAAGVFQQIGQGIGNVVQSYVLLGTAGGATLRKFTAQVLASVASQAAVLAAFELAKGFAALFFNPPEAASHFTAAAIFGGIAGVAAVAGRAVAGNSFQQASASGATNGSSQSSSRDSSGSNSNDPRIIEQNRNQPQRIELMVRSNDSHIVNVVQQDYYNNGPTRSMILNVVEG